VVVLLGVLVEVMAETMSLNTGSKAGSRFSGAPIVTRLVPSSLGRTRAQIRRCGRKNTR